MDKTSSAGVAVNGTNGGEVAPKGLARREVLKVLGAFGVGSAVFGRAVVALAQDQPRITTETIQQAEWISGLKFTDKQREMMARGVNRTLAQYDSLRKIKLDNGVVPAGIFNPLPCAAPVPTMPREPVGLIESSAAKRPTSEEVLAFAPVSELAPLIRTRQLSSVELTRLYLKRLGEFDATLHCVITLTEKLALDQAAKADREIAAGRYRGPLHGIPWGAKDLLAYPGYPTTWGAKPYAQQVRKEKATVAARLDAAGAVLVAKLSVGALAMGDVWFGETCRNPWKPSEGSSGSSAGPASATVAGLIGFAIGTETLGSIVSPCRRCGATGLRPTFGRVSRFGCMALSWSMDKIGPIARSVEDCALVFHAIHGADGLDPSAVERPFHWPPRKDVRALRVGYVKDLFEAPEPSTQSNDDGDRRKLQEEQRALDHATLATLRQLGIELVPIELPKTYPLEALLNILDAEAATAFDDLTRSGRDASLVRQGPDAWPNIFRQGQLIPAVEYLRASRVRTLVMREMAQMMSHVDVYVAPTYGGGNLLLTNLTGHPAVVLPNGFRSEDGTPTSITFTGSLFGESDLLAVAHAYQSATDFHLKRPSVENA
jgi:Asp-tRNA(Asn)/Glu-tRNA(Gln) amidotransferase A subunit family amidase